MQKSVKALSFIPGVLHFEYKQHYFSDGVGYQVDTVVNGCIFPHLVPIELVVERMQSRANDNEL